MCAEVTSNGGEACSGEFIPAELVVWAAGVKAPEFLAQLDGLETNRINQLVVRPTLQTTRDENIFAHRRLRRLCRGRVERSRRAAPRAGRASAGDRILSSRSGDASRCSRCAPWRYRDFGSLVSLGEYSTVGNLMGSLIGRNIWIEGCSRA